MSGLLQLKVWQLELGAFAMSLELLTLTTTTRGLLRSKEV
jgi:hypothetical protein